MTLEARVDTTFSARVREEVEQFLFVEADLLDSWRIEEWLTLFTQDCRYWVPANDDRLDPEKETALVYDRYTDLEDRVLRLLSPAAHSQSPRSRTRRVVSNIRLTTHENGDVGVFSNFILFEVRLNRERVFGGGYEHRLRRDGNAWRIVLKKVSLVNNDLPLNNLTVLL